MGWLDEVSGRLLATIVDQRLRPERHGPHPANQCGRGCPVHEYEADMNQPVLEREIAEEQRREERLRAFAEQFNEAMRSG